MSSSCRRLWFFWLLATAATYATALAVLPSPAAAQDTAASRPRIDTVIVVTHDVFDQREAEGNLIFAVANALRFKTRPEIVRRELLFSAGDFYDPDRIAESERNLRRMGIFRDVTIDSFRIEGRLAVRVETRDGWSTQLRLNGRSTGDEFTWSAGLFERNFLGTATLVGASYRDDPDRTALTLRARIDRLLGTRALVDGSYDDRSDGEIAQWVVGVPFRAFQDRRGFELWGEAGTHRVLRFRDGSLADSLERRALVHRLVLAAAPYTGGRGYLRVGLAAQFKRETYTAFARAPEDSSSGAVGLGLEWLQARFLVVTHYNGFAREEDLDLSTRGRFLLWVAPSAFGYPEFGIGPGLEFQTGAVLGPGFAKLQLRANALLTEREIDSARVWAGVTLGARSLGRQATVFHLEAAAQRGLPPGSEIDLGHGVGPRAFGSHAFTGDRSVWATLEHRWFAWDEVVGLLGVGFAAFFDYGGAWYRDQPARLGGNVGLGLRLGATRATGSNVGRIDLAYRFGQGWSGSRWVVSVGRSYTF
ncbi:Outer membrane protein assembly factor BamA [bacterium HR33]|nr:Outer membrane protein assembly factor BamA [bacterium HR33]